MTLDTATEERFSDRLLAMLSFDILDADGNDIISMQDIVNALRERGFGLLIVLLSLPSAVPGVPPPIPSIFGAPVAMLAIQMIMRYSHPKLPDLISRKTIKRSQLNGMIAKFHSYLRYTDFLIKPRLKFLTSSRNEPLIGMIILFFTLIVIIPLPLTNSVPSIATILMSIGVISRDGLFLLAGIVLGFAWAVFLLFISNELIALAVSMFS